MDITEPDKLLDPSYELSILEWDDFTRLTASILEAREYNQRLLGRLASELTKKYGAKAIKDLAQKVEGATGRKVPASSLMTYRWVWERVGHLAIPQDVPYYVWRLLAKVENPQEWIDKLLASGWSGAELRKQMMLFRGEEPKVHVCPNCGAILNDKKHSS